MVSDHHNWRLPPHHRQIDTGIWRCCAGKSVEIPAVDSRVYYFPQGHLAQSSTSITFPSNITSKFSIPCHVAGVLLTADHNSDEVFAKILLHPFTGGFSGDGKNDAVSFVKNLSHSDAKNGGIFNVCDRNDVVSFVKILTPSDANNGGGFSVPKFCADSIFPPMDYKADPPVMNIRVRDVHGEVWEFRYIYRGSPRRHLLTTGWSKFVNTKKLIAGDSVVFMRNRVTQNLFVGIRRAVRVNDVSGCGSQHVGRVFEGMERASTGLEFEVVYYPRIGLSDFVVGAEKVEKALRVYWYSGMRVKIGMETDDCSRMTWYQGTVASVVVPGNGQWVGSTWKMLQVAWDEPEILHNMKRVSPWQIEYVASPPPTHTTLLPTKRLKAMLEPTFGLSSEMTQSNFFPAGMQGARHNPSVLFSFLPNIVNEGAPPMCAFDIKSNMTQKVKNVSTDLNVGSSPSETPSPDSQKTLQLIGTDTKTQVNSSNLSTKNTSFQLFGTTIHMEQPLPTKDDIKCNGYANGIIVNTIDHSLADPCKNLIEGLGAQSQRSPVLETFALSIHGL